MIKQRVHTLEAFGRKEFFGVQPAVGTAELNVAFVRQGSGANVGWHELLLWRGPLLGAEAVLAMAAVAKRLEYRTAAATEHEVLLDGIRISVGVDQAHTTRYQVGTVLTDFDDDVFHLVQGVRRVLGALRCKRFVARGGNA